MSDAMSFAKDQQPVATRGKRPRVLVSLEDKERAIARIRNGETKAGISRELGVPESTVRGWVKRAEQRLIKEAEIRAATAVAALNGATGNTRNIPTMSNGKPSSSAFTNTTNCNEAPGFSVNPVPRRTWPAALPALTPSTFHEENPEHNACVLAWLKLFNDGLLNFTYIVTAAVFQSQFLGVSEDPLWKIVDRYVNERGANPAFHFNNNTHNNLPNVMGPIPYLNLPVSTSLHPVSSLPLAHSTQLRELSSVTVSLAKPKISNSVVHGKHFHVTASDDELGKDDDTDDDEDEDDCMNEATQMGMDTD